LKTPIPKWLLALFDWLYRDRRPEHVRKSEQEFIRAVNQLKTLYATDRGGMSIDPEELRGQILESRESLRHLVDPSHRKVNSQERRGVAIHEDVSSQLDFFEVVTWRHADDGSVIRYICLQDLKSHRWTVAAVDHFGDDEAVSPAQDYCRVADLIKAAAIVKPLLWHKSLEEAINAYSTDGIGSS